MRADESHPRSDRAVWPPARAACFRKSCRHSASYGVPPIHSSALTLSNSRMADFPERCRIRFACCSFIVSSFLFMIGWCLGDDFGHYGRRHAVARDELGAMFMHLGQPGLSRGADVGYSGEIHSNGRLAIIVQKIAPTPLQLTHPLPFQLSFELEGDDSRFVICRNSQHRGHFNFEGSLRPAELIARIPVMGTT